MTLPGFMADSALYQSSRNYGSYTLPNGSHKSAVVPLAQTDRPDIWEMPCDSTDPGSDCYEPSDPGPGDFWHNFPEDDRGGGANARMPVRCWSECQGNARYLCCRGEGWWRCSIRELCLDCCVRGVCRSGRVCRRQRGSRLET